MTTPASEGKKEFPRGDRAIESGLSSSTFSVLHESNPTIFNCHERVHFGNGRSGQGSSGKGNGRVELEIALLVNLLRLYHTLCVQGTGMDYQKI